MAGERVERRLAAILAADVAGYSRLIGVDEEGILAALGRNQQRAPWQRPENFALFQEGRRLALAAVAETDR